MTSYIRMTSVLYCVHFNHTSTFNYVLQTSIFNFT